jgi:hypothetical protein
VVFINWEIFRYIRKCVVIIGEYLDVMVVISTTNYLTMPTQYLGYERKISEYPPYIGVLSCIPPKVGYSCENYHIKYYVVTSICI